MRLEDMILIVCFFKRLSGVIYLGGLEVSDAHAAVKRSLALVNSSLSEGNSVAILEVS